MQLIENWKKAYRMFSIQAMTLAAAVQGGWTSIPEDLRALAPAGLVHWLTLGLLVMGIAGRLMNQGTVTAP